MLVPKNIKFIFSNVSRTSRQPQNIKHNLCGLWLLLTKLLGIHPQKYFVKCWGGHDCHFSAKNRLFVSLSATYISYGFYKVIIINYQKNSKVDIHNAAFIIILGIRRCIEI
jgi:hypothetical protein